ncbi:MAG: DUF853 family protein [Lachnospiraceae bacterium]|nr:DUF853 family protein [Lachnospiraceae bacterium]
MYHDGKIWIGNSGEEKIYIYPKMANRHGLIAGATGTGKTVTLKVLAESFSDAGIPVFLADVKGDLAGMSMFGAETDSVKSRVEKMGLAEEGFDFSSYPTTYWDIYGEKGMPLRATISEMGPLLLSRILDLNETQSDILTVIFKIADDEGLLLLDTKDLRSMIQYVSDHTKDYAMEYGNMAKQSLAAIVRSIVALEAEGGDKFFGEPAVSIADWLCTDCSGKGAIQVLDCQKLINNPAMYSTFMLWLMAELFETLPEAGDRPKPKMVFFFDEAHLLFDNASKTLLTKVEQMVKLIRSKGVGIYFITQNPADIPDDVLGQLGNKVQHALRAYTPKEQKGAKAAADSFRANPEFDTYEVLSQLGIGEALVSVLDEEGIPTVVKQCKILPPQSLMGALDDETRKSEIVNNLLYTKYTQEIDRESAYELLTRKIERQAEEEAKEKAAERKATAQEKEVKRAVKNVARSASGTIGRELGKSIGESVGGSFGKRLGGNVGASLGRGILNTLFK